MSTLTEQPSKDRHSPPYTYAGLLDDVMLRYSDEFNGPDFFRKMIAKNVLFGDGIFINDGYLVNHPVARRHLVDENSPLHMMLVMGFVKILTRTNSPDALARMPIAMAESGSQSFQTLVRSSEWNDFGPAFKELAELVFQRENYRKWPNVNMSYGYAKLMEQHFIGKTALQMGLSVLDTDDVRFIGDAFLELNPRQGNARDKFEKAATQVLEKRDRFSRSAMREIMEVANQCYHYNFGLAMTQEMEKLGKGIAVDTTIGKTFDGLLATESVSRDQVSNVPLLGIPDSFPFDDGGFLLRLLDTTSTIGQAKMRYLRQLSTLLSSDLSEASEAQLVAAKKEMADAADEYSRRLAELLARQIHGLPAASYPLTVMTGYTGGPEASLPALQAQFVMAIRLREKEQATRRTRDILFKRFRLKDVAEGQHLPENEVIFVKDIRPQIASLGFDRDHAAQFLQDIPPMT